MTDTTPKQAPNTLVYAFWALIAAAVCSVLAALSYAASRTWLKSELFKSGNKSLTKAQNALASAKTAADKSAAQKDIDKYKVYDTKAHALSTINHDASSIIVSQIISGFLVAAILVLLAWQLKRYRSGARWGVVAIWIFTTFFGFAAVGLGGLLMIASGAPIALKLPSAVGAICMIAAVVLVNLPSTTSFLNAHRPARANAGGAPGLGSLFRPRPAPSSGSPAENPAPSAKPAQRATRQPAKPPANRTSLAKQNAPVEAADATPSTKSNGQTQRAKAKGRASDETNASAAVPRSNAAAAKNRGKRRS